MMTSRSSSDVTALPQPLALPEMVDVCWANGVGWDELLRDFTSAQMTEYKYYEAMLGTYARPKPEVATDNALHLFERLDMESNIMLAMHDDGQWYIVKANKPAAGGLHSCNDIEFMVTATPVNGQLRY